MTACDKQQCPNCTWPGIYKRHILIPEAVEFGGSLFFGHSPISKQWLITRFIFFALSLTILLWSITYHILRHQLLEWIYWMNNWSLLLSVIYLLLSFIVTYKISEFVNQQQLKLSNLRPYNVKKSKIMNETTSFALKSPNAKKYKSISQMDESNELQDDDNRNSFSLAISVDSNGIDKRDDDFILAMDNNNIHSLPIINDESHSHSHSPSSYSPKLNHYNHMNNLNDLNDSDGGHNGYNSFKIASEKTNILNMNDSFTHTADIDPDVNIINDHELTSDSVIFWLFTLKRMKIINLATLHKKFLQTVMALNMVSVIVYIAFIYEYNLHFVSNSLSFFSLFVNSGIAQSFILLIEYYSSALTMSYNGVVYPIFIAVCYGIMSIVFSIFSISHSADLQMEENNINNGSIGKIYLLICCDWIGNPLHAILHLLSIIFILILFHTLFTATKNIILSSVWSYHIRHCSDDDIAFYDDIYTTTMHINGVKDGNKSNMMMNKKNMNNRHIKTEICDINMDNIKESNIFLDASVSAFSSSVEVQYYDNKHANVNRQRVISNSEVELQIQNLPILEEDDMVNDIIVP